jgi:hypothetical protein
VRVAGAIRALAALMLQVYPDSIVEAYTVRAIVCFVCTVTGNKLCEISFHADLTISGGMQ